MASRNRSFLGLGCRNRVNRRKGVIAGCEVKKDEHRAAHQLRSNYKFRRRRRLQTRSPDGVLLHYAESTPVPDKGALRQGVALTGDLPLIGVEHIVIDAGQHAH